MTLNQTQIPQEIQNKVYSRFVALPLEERLVVYAKFVHGNMFKSQNNDLFGLSRRATGKIYKAFLDLLREDMNLEDS